MLSCYLAGGSTQREYFSIDRVLKVRWFGGCLNGSLSGGVGFIRLSLRSLCRVGCLVTAVKRRMSGYGTNCLMAGLC